jgi:hypothetical protein
MRNFNWNVQRMRHVERSVKEQNEETRLELRVQKFQSISAVGFGECCPLFAEAHGISCRNPSILWMPLPLADTYLSSTGPKGECLCRLTGGYFRILASPESLDVEI